MLICNNCKVQFECGFYEETFEKIFKGTNELRTDNLNDLADAIEDVIHCSHFECEYKK